MKKLFLLPAVALFGLVGCGQKPAAPAEEVVIPTVTDSAIKTAYDAGCAITSGETAAQTFSGVVVATSGNSFFLQDGYCGMYVYNKAVANIAVGKMVSVVSTIQNYNGLIETKTITSATLGEDGTLPTSVKVLTLDQLGQLKQSILVHAELEFVSKNKEWNSSNSVQVTAKLRKDGQTTEESIVVSYNKFSFTAAQGAIVNALNAGDKFTVAGCVTTAYNADQAGKSNQLYFGSTSTTTKL